MEISFWKRWLKFNIYKKLWSLILGRPWTFASRDIWHQFEYIPIVALFVGGYYFGKYGGDLLSTLIIFTIGYILGHFFWGKVYIKNQKGN